MSLERIIAAALVLMNPDRNLAHHYSRLMRHINP